MTTRITCPDEATAETLATGIDAAGHDVAVIAERDAAGAEVHVVFTPADPGELAELLPPGASVEVY
jgi:hypothetical protein